MGSQGRRLDSTLVTCATKTDIKVGIHVMPKFEGEILATQVPLKSSRFHHIKCLEDLHFSVDKTLPFCVFFQNLVRNFEFLLTRLRTEETHSEESQSVEQALFEVFQLCFLTSLKLSLS
jgi:hypothetical protein